MIHTKFIQKIILYNYIDIKNYSNHISLINNLIVLNKLICRQQPLYIINKKNRIVGTKNTLIKHKLNLFLHKLILFTIPNIQKTSTLHDNVFKFDEHYNISFVVRNQTYFFECRKYKISDFTNNYTFNIKLIFNDHITSLDKITYMNKIMKQYIK